MKINLKSSSKPSFNKLLPFLLSLIDDALVLGLSRLGLHIQWLHWLSPIILLFTVVYSVVQLFPYCYKVWKNLGLWQ
jgi:hypothetical protein